MGRGVNVGGIVCCAFSLSVGRRGGRVCDCLNCGDFQRGHRWSQGGSAAEMVRDLWWDGAHFLLATGAVWGALEDLGVLGGRALCDPGAEGLCLRNSAWKPLCGRVVLLGDSGEAGIATSAFISL